MTALTGGAGSDSNTAFGIQKDVYNTSLGKRNIALSIENALIPVMKNTFFALLLIFIATI